MGQQPPLGLLVMAHGTPKTMDDVEAFYTRIRRGRPPSAAAVAELQERYELIGGTSPLLTITQDQATALARRLEERLQRPVHSYLGMLYAPPLIQDVVNQMAADGIRRCIGVVMAPQYSVMSIGGYQREARAAIAAAAPTGQIEATFIDHWHQQPKFVQALATRVTQALAQLPADIRDESPIVFTAHSLPERVVETGDPYREHLLETAQAVADAAGLFDWDIAFQSASATGVPWLGPDIAEVIADLGRRGTPGMVVCPAGFVADHLEVLYDLDIEARAAAAKANVAYARTASLNADPDFIDALADAVIGALGEQSPDE